MSLDDQEMKTNAARTGYCNSFTTVAGEPLRPSPAPLEVRIAEAAQDVIEMARALAMARQGYRQAQETLQHAEAGFNAASSALGRLVEQHRMPEEGER